MDAPAIDLSGVERRISTVSSQVNDLNKRFDQVNGRFDKVDSQIEGVKNELEQLRKDFLDMVEEQRRTAALEQATTELVSVRQEMEKKFGGYSTVRNTMVGILQATDAALVRKTTISTVSEELMVSTPDYWLAPVLVALAAWISNDRDLAERAIKEAIRRDNEHTSLTMALVCRRAGRISTCYEWLSRYFDTQDAARINGDSMVYIDAYINGVFGPDEKHLCGDYMARWIDQLQKKNPDFKEKQSVSWAEYFESREEDMGMRYPALQAVVKEFDYINKYLGRLEAISNIRDQFEGIKKSEVNTWELTAQVDAHLMELVKSDDREERKLRAQEEYLLAVKACAGDVKQARKVVNQHREDKRKETMNIVDQMTKSMRRNKNDGELYKKKTAMQFLGGYINQGFDRYRKSEIPAFPQVITLNFDGWSGQAQTGDEGATLKAGYAAFLESKKQEEITQLNSTVSKSSIGNIAAAVVLALIGVFFMPIGIVFLAGAAFFAWKAFGANKKRTEGLQAIENRYASQYQQGAVEIDLALSQWKTAKNVAVAQKDLLQLDRVA